MTNDNDNYTPLSQRTEAELIRQLGELELELNTLNALATNRSLYINEGDYLTLAASV